LQNFAFVIDGPPEVVGDTVDLYENLFQMPSQVGQGPHAVDPLVADLGGEHWAEAVPQKPDDFVTDLDTSLVQQVFDVAQRKRVTDTEHHRQANDLRAGFERPERGRLRQFYKPGEGPAGLKRTPSHIVPPFSHAVSGSARSLLSGRPIHPRPHA
jgi:hypothetical protein